MIDIQNHYCPNKFEKLLPATKYSQKREETVQLLFQRFN